jgi:hypothetical protein
MFVKSNLERPRFYKIGDICGARPIVGDAIERTSQAVLIGFSMLDGAILFASQKL